MKSLTIAMPAYNEAENIQAMIEETVQAVSPLVEDFEIIVVDDGSQDDTAVIVQSLIPQYPQLRLALHGENKGYGTAVFSGLTHASKEFIFFTDADRQFDLGEIEKLLAEIDRADLVVGYRAPRRDPFMRRLNGRGWSGLVTLLFGYTARDIDCAFKLMRRRVVDALRDEITSGGATFSAEFLVRAKRAGFRIAEVPVTGHRPRVAGNPTGAHPKVILRAFRELVSLRLQLWQGDDVAVERLVERETGAY
ncbi:MAG TPA: glycosyltransferase family 2 protein [Chloroflexi bacterium]|nr:glycosyltransferase family 2 protein [Chloroflexota bacterium]